MMLKAYKILDFAPRLTQRVGLGGEDGEGRGIRIYMYTLVMQVLRRGFL